MAKKKTRGPTMMPAVLMPEGDIPASLSLPIVNFVVLPRIGEKIHLGDVVACFKPGRYVVRDVVFQPVSPTAIVHRIVIRPVVMMPEAVMVVPMRPETPAAPENGETRP